MRSFEPMLDWVIGNLLAIYTTKACGNVPVAQRQ